VASTGVYNCKPITFYACKTGSSHGPSVGSAAAVEHRQGIGYPWSGHRQDRRRWSSSASPEPKPAMPSGRLPARPEPLAKASGQAFLRAVAECMLPLIMEPMARGGSTLADSSAPPSAQPGATITASGASRPGSAPFNLKLSKLRAAGYPRNSAMSTDTTRGRASHLSTIRFAGPSTP
jgi:hypothetical protein